MFWWIFYIVSVVYCLWRVFKSYKKQFDNSAIGPTPGLDTLMLLVFAPVFAIVDLSLTWIRLVKDAEEAKRRNNQI